MNGTSKGNGKQYGHDYEKKYRGCARWTVAALQDAVPFVPADQGLLRGATCLDAATTPTGIHSCGAFIGCAMVIGYVCATTTGGEAFEASGSLSDELIRKVYQRFEGEYGSVLCKDVKEAANHDCPEVVGKAAKWTAEVLLKEFTDYT